MDIEMKNFIDEFVQIFHTFKTWSQIFIVKTIPCLFYIQPEHIILLDKYTEIGGNNFQVQRKKRIACFYLQRVLLHVLHEDGVCVSVYAVYISRTVRMF